LALVQCGRAALSSHLLLARRRAGGGLGRLQRLGHRRGRMGTGHRVYRLCRRRQPHLDREPPHPRDDGHRQRPGHLRLAHKRRLRSMADHGRYSHRPGPAVRRPHDLIERGHTPRLPRGVQRVRLLGRPHLRQRGVRARGSLGHLRSGRRKRLARLRQPEPGPSRDLLPFQPGRRHHPDS
jgi:hypothetical protein